MTDPQDKTNWLERPETIRKLWWIFGIVLAITVLLQLIISVKGKFAIEAWFGFGAVFGFASCFLMVVVAKALGVLVKRPEDYYHPVEEGVEASEETDRGV